MDNIVINGNIIGFQWEHLMFVYNQCSTEGFAQYFHEQKKIQGKDLDDYWYSSIENFINM